MTQLTIAQLETIISQLETVILQLQNFLTNNNIDSANIKTDLQNIVANLKSFKEKAVILKTDIDFLSASYPKILKAIEILVLAVFAKVFTNSL